MNLSNLFQTTTSSVSFDELTTYDTAWNSHEKENVTSNVRNFENVSQQLTCSKVARIGFIHFT